MTGNSGAWRVYIDAVLRIDAPGGVIWVRPAPISTTSGKYPAPDGRAICVITAHNPGGRVASGADNAAGQAQLVAVLEEQGLKWWPAAGGDPSWTHVEDSAAVIGMDEADAIGLGAQFGQDAIFVLTPADRQVVGCAHRRVVATGWSIEPEADSPAGTGAASAVSSAAATMSRSPGIAPGSSSMSRQPPGAAAKLARPTPVIVAGAPAARYGEPGHDRRRREISTGFEAIRAQDDQLKLLRKPG